MIDQHTKPVSLLHLYIFFCNKLLYFNVIKPVTSFIMKNDGRSAVISSTNTMNQKIKKREYRLHEIFFEKENFKFPPIVCQYFPFPRKKKN